MINTVPALVFIVISESMLWLSSMIYLLVLQVLDGDLVDHPDVGAVVGEVHRLLITDLAGEVAPEIPLAGWPAVQGDGALEVDLTQQEGEHLCVLPGSCFSCSMSPSM